MAETNERINNDKFQLTIKRKFDRFRAKLTELFFSTSVNQVNSINSYHNSSIVKKTQQQQQPDDNNSMLISNCYYGYTSPINDEDLRISCKNKSKQFQKNITSSSSSSACSSSSSMIIDDDEHSTLSNYTSQNSGELVLSQYPVNFDSQFSLPQSLTTGVITLNKSLLNQPSTNLDYYNFNSHLNSINSNFDTSSLNTNEEDNPFLNKRLTDQIHFNSDLKILASYFEAALELIDDMDNFFNIDFMTNYIAYILLKQINESDLLKQSKWSLKLMPSADGTNLLKEIAEKIFLESHDEPCGLKGCNISVYVQTEDVYDMNQTVNKLVSEFQFGTSRFGAFDLNLFLKHDLKESHVDEQGSSTIATLTRRLFNNVKSNVNTKQYPSDETIIYLDSSTYDLFKTNLAYE